MIPDDCMMHFIVLWCRSHITGLNRLRHQLCMYGYLAVNSWCFARPASFRPGCYIKKQSRKSFLWQAEDSNKTAGARAKPCTLHVQIFDGKFSGPCKTNLIGAWVLHTKQGGIIIRLKLPLTLVKLVWDTQKWFMPNPIITSGADKVSRLINTY